MADTSIKHLTYTELLLRVRDPQVSLVDVLPQEMYAQGHIPDSINLPYKDIPTQASLLFPDPMQRMVVYCANAS